MTDNGSPWLRVMSFNLHVDWPASPRPWRARRDVVAHLLRMERPRLIGTQEGLHGPLRDLEADLGPEHYGWTGQGREGGSRGEFMTIGYDRTRLRPLEYDHFWLSGTPQEPGSNTWGGSRPRMVTWVRFHDLSGGGELFAANTHFDDASAYARDCSAELLAERLITLAPEIPRIVTGDFNTPAGASTVHAALLTRADLVDTWEPPRNAARPTAPSTTTGHRSPAATASTGSSRPGAPACAGRCSTTSHRTAVTPATICPYRQSCAPHADPHPARHPDPRRTPPS
ncbi:endonuclease/exonuclease/phosphatase family protein [Streptomyces sp. NPDC096354]|uniref:endonuclease/exonuclease/phosphatase family protein n=1 Tax=Streptomyces sp. NPDC096354 TaxID=3366088 RepID=UPI0037F6EB23